MLSMLLITRILFALYYTYSLCSVLHLFSLLCITRILFALFILSIMRVLLSLLTYPYSFHTLLCSLC
ncbi:hypothetical protein B484DRAFT_455615 [Ochromonadaceae sp. CCMP2298]|nr:hypothetical protein B484DRAFT_455615 [Ochromonadaceae sp. CCMP2298]